MFFVLGMALSGCGATPSTGPVQGNLGGAPASQTIMPAPTAAQPTAAPPLTGAASAAMTVKMGEPFQLAVGQSAQLASGQFSLTFATVAEDSRCPRGVDCVWAGQVVVVLDVTQNGQASSPIKLTLGGAGRTANAASAQASGQTVQLMAVDPYPQAGKNIAPADYRVMLEVR